MEPLQKKNRCQARTKAGEPCRAAPTAGGLCFFHANPNKASVLGRIGGRSNRGLVRENLDPLPTLENVQAIQETIARLVGDVYAGKTHPRVASGLAPLLVLQLRTIEITGMANLERRIAELERLRLSEADAKLGEIAGTPTE
jgi:hypothetical protein